MGLKLDVGMFSNIMVACVLSPNFDHKLDSFSFSLCHPVNSTMMDKFVVLDRESDGKRVEGIQSCR